MEYVQPIGGAVNDPYVDANPALGVEGSAVPAAAIEHPMREIINVITAAGLPQNAGDLTQLKQAIAQMIVNGGPVKASVRVASTVAINLAAPGANIDGVAMVAGDRFLEKDNGAGEFRGIYIWNGAAVPATRAGDADGAGEIVAGMLVVVQEGTANADTIWELTTDGTITVGTTALTFALAGSSKFVKKAGDTLLGALALFGGDTGVTPAQFDDSTKVATTEFVETRGIQAGGVVAINTTQTLTAAHFGKSLLVGSTSAPITLTAPPATAGVVNGRIELFNPAAYPVTFQRNGTDLFYMSSASVTSVVINPGDSLTIEVYAAGQWYAVGGSAQLGYASAFGSLLAANGYKKIPDANSPTGYMIKQWGTGVTAIGGGVVTFPVAFPNVCRNVECTVQAAGAPANYIGRGALTTVGFSVWNNTNSAGTGFDWLAIGY